MSNNNDAQTIVDYDSDLIGTIKSHLEALQGYDVMALELIQNADDAKADEVVFDITKDGLRVWNSGAFRYCGNLSDRICQLQQTEKYACDFHRIKLPNNASKWRTANIQLSILTIVPNGKRSSGKPFLVTIQMIG